MRRLRDKVWWLEGKGMVGWGAELEVWRGVSGYNLKG